MRVCWWLFAATLTACLADRPAEIALHADPRVADFATAVPDEAGAVVPVRVVNVGDDCLRVARVAIEGDDSGRLQVVNGFGRVLHPAEVFDVAVLTPDFPLGPVLGAPELVIDAEPVIGLPECNDVGAEAATLRIPIVPGIPTWCDADADEVLGPQCGGEDCADDDPLIPGPVEYCNGLDDDCDGEIDEPVAADAPTWYFDADRDGYGDEAITERTCTAPYLYVALSGDCDDDDPATYPGAEEVCDGIDQDCDGTPDDGLPTSTFHADTDGDGYGDPDVTVESCGEIPGVVLDDTDCDDAVAEVHPDADELCNGRDDDCDGPADEDAIDAGTWYVDGDGDTWGGTESVTACVQPEGTAARTGDCNDAVAAVHPGADELCNGRDDDCDGPADEDAIDGDPWYPDDDLDGFGDEDLVTLSCDPIPGWIQVGADCDDGNADINPLATETCDAVDEDCDGLIDDGANTCPCPVEHLEGHAYAYCDVPVPFFIARFACQASGYDLVSLNDATEDVWVTATAGAQGGGTWWIGYTDQAQEGAWLWVDGSTTSYTGWAPGRPASGPNNNADCARIGGNNGWFDEACLNFHPFVCEAGP